MAYQCPRCGAAVSRAHNQGAALAGGLVGSLLFSAFASLECEKCGPIPGKEFPSEVRMEMWAGTLAMLGVAALLFVGVLWLLGYLNL